jgi:hypothetical protein
MTEPEGFLSRWSRLKRDTVEAENTSAPPDETAADEHHQNADDAKTSSIASGVNEDATAPAPPSIDLSKLPPIESITAATDIRAFLAPGVPLELSRAALRRAWVADPNIRTFIGIAENQWDFTAPETIPGFGSLTAVDNVRQLVADVFGDISQHADAERTVPSDRIAVDDAQPVDEPEESARREIAEEAPSAARKDEPAPTSVAGASKDEAPVAVSSDAVQHGENDAATQSKSDDPTGVIAARPRRHGRALPKG